MKKEIKRWVRFWMPGAFFGESRDVDLPIYTEPSAVKWPDDAYAFTLHERTEIVDDDGARYLGKPQQLGPMFFHPDSQVMTLAEVELDPRATKILLDNMRVNGWDRIVWSRWGNWPQQFDPEKCLVLKGGNGSEKTAGTNQRP